MSKSDTTHDDIPGDANSTLDIPQNDPTQPTFSDINQSNENDDMEQQDDFGSFDDAMDDDDFGSFDGQDEPEELPIDETPIFETLQDAIKLWQHLLDQIYNYKALESFTGNAPKNIKQYVLEEAPESLHSRLTWDSVTRYMENDTGIPKVKWHQSEIERFHLMALDCKRSATPLTMPTMLNTSVITQEPAEITTSKPILNTLIGSTTPSASSVSTSPSVGSNNTTTPTAEKRSSVFGLSSLSRFLPHLSKTNLPKSPTSPISSSAIAASKSFPRQVQPSNAMDAVNHLNISTLRQDAGTETKRSNSVAFISTRSQPDIPASFSNTQKPRPTSFQASQSMDLFDLTEDPTTILKSPTKLQFNFEPLVPTHTLSPSPTSAPRRNTVPAFMHSEIKPNTTALDAIPDDDFGDFAAEEDLGDDGFDDFKQETLQPTQKALVNPTPINSIDDDPFGIMGKGNVNNALDNDPYGVASYSQPLPAQQTNNLVGIDSSYTQSPHVFKPTTPVESPKMLTPTAFDILTPTSPLNRQLKAEPVKPATTFNNSIQNDLLELSYTFTSSSPSVKTDSNTNVADDDDWGDWAF